MRTLIILALVSQLLITACRPAVAPAPTPVILPIATAVPFKMITGEFNTRQMLELMYSGEAISISDDTALIRRPPFEEYTTPFQINLVTAYQQAGIDKRLVITNGAFDTCHVCPATMDGGVFSKIQDEWQLTVLRKNIINLGSLGYVAKGTPIRISDEKYGAMLISEYDMQGSQNVSIAIISEIEGDIKVVFNEPIITGGNDCQGAICKWRYTFNLQPVPVEHAAYYDLLLIQSGADESGSAVNFIRTYAFSSTNYIPVSCRDRSEEYHFCKSFTGFRSSIP
jgi:hypothetical protein